MVDLKEQFGKKYRIFVDEAWEAEDSQSNPNKVKDKPWYYEKQNTAQILARKH